MAAKGETMFYRKNMGPKERWVRGVLGGGMVVGAFALLGATPLALMVAGGGVMAVLTGMVGFCPACAMVGRAPAEDGQ
jgi:hypothetical protein